ncbi:hypothetical protein [Borrelia anserina]|nr:hypothetical protein [Borrelia anserina]
MPKNLFEYVEVVFMSLYVFGACIRSLDFSCRLYFKGIACIRCDGQL